VPTESFHALAHADEPQAAPFAVLDIESPTFVGDVHMQISIVTPEAD